MKLKSVSSLILFIATCLTSFAGIGPGKFVQAHTVDVCIYGGNAAGVIAAYTAKKCGKTVLLIEPGRTLGGLTTGGLGKTDIGNKQAITGLAKQFYQRIGAKYGLDEEWVFEPRVAEEVIQDYIKAGNVEVLFQRELFKVNKSGKAIKSVLVRDPESPGSTPSEVLAKQFIDCTYEGDLLAMAGVSFTVGREDNKKYNETLSGFQLPEYHKQSGFHQFPDGVDPYKIPGVPSSGLVWGISNAKSSPTGSGDKKVQTYNLRICLTDSVENSIPITRPAGYDSTKYELLVRLFQAQPAMRKINDYFIWSLMPNRKTDINNRGAFSTDMIGMNYGWPAGSYQQRKKIYEDHVSYTKGLLYFMKTDKRVPEELQEFVSHWGYPKDEFKAFGNFTPQLYVREARRMVGEYVMTERNCLGIERVADSIGQAAYGMDSHNIQRIVQNGMVKNEGNVEVGNFPPYPVSYRAIVPKQSECTNLVVPVCLSASHIAYGSIRMEPVFMVLGQSSAMAACLAIDEKVPVQKINVLKLQNWLKSNPTLDKSGSL